MHLILYSYIARIYSGKLLLFFTQVTALGVIAYMMTNIEDFIDSTEALLEALEGMLINTINVIDLILIISVLMATVSTISLLKRNSELIIINYEGLSMLRIIIPLLLVSSIFVLGGYWSKNYLYNYIRPDTASNINNVEQWASDYNHLYYLGQNNEASKPNQYIFTWKKNAMSIDKIQFNDSTLQQQNDTNVPQTMHQYQTSVNSWVYSQGLYVKQDTIRDFSTSDFIKALEHTPIDKLYDGLSGVNKAQYRLALLFKTGELLMPFSVIFMVGGLAGLSDRGRGQTSAGTALALVFGLLLFLGYNVLTILGTAGMINPLLGALSVPLGTMVLGIIFLLIGK